MCTDVSLKGIDGLVLILLCSAYLFPVSSQAALFSGQVTALTIYSKDSRQHRGTTELGRLRLEFGHQKGPLSLKLVYDHEWLWGAAVRDPIFPVLSEAPDPTWLELSDTIDQTAALFWRHNLYRGWIRYEQDNIRFTAGRQRLAWGSGRIWNPTDRFNPVQPTALEPDQKTGVDALAMNWFYSDVGSLAGVLAPGKSRRGLARKTALRWQDTVGEFDLSILGARVGQEDALGLDLTGNLGQATIRFESLFSDGGGLTGYSQWIAGVDATWYPVMLPNGLYLAAELFYNDDPTVSSNALSLLNQSSDRLQSHTNYQLGFLAGYDLTPLWRLEALTIFDLEHPSWFVAPSLKWSWMENIDLTFSSRLFGGQSIGEFASQSAVYLVNIEAYL
ncbi:MAG: hypothetical protein D6698_06885 [Gammaproteobacteria bacterium]|nr:MAG: hypothetical protein D6698_06885 [Gammaproteobacteria bacterium]